MILDSSTYSSNSVNDTDLAFPTDDGRLRRLPLRQVLLDIAKHYDWVRKEVFWSSGNQ